MLEHSLLAHLFVSSLQRRTYGRKLHTVVQTHHQSRGEGSVWLVWSGGREGTGDGGLCAGWLPRAASAAAGGRGLAGWAGGHHTCPEVAGLFAKASLRNSLVDGRMDRQPRKAQATGRGGRLAVVLEGLLEQDWLAGLAGLAWLAVCAVCGLHPVRVARLCFFAGFSWLGARTRQSGRRLSLGLGLKLELKTKTGSPPALEACLRIAVRGWRGGLGKTFPCFLRFCLFISVRRGGGRAGWLLRRVSLSPSSFAAINASAVRVAVVSFASLL